MRIATNCRIASPVPVLEVAWAEELAREQIARQRADGTWTNPVGASKEDDPLVATPLAAGALALSRATIGPWFRSGAGFRRRP